MGDGGKWFKLHCDFDDDPHISSLSPEDQLRWIKLGTYMKKHGTDGSVTIVYPALPLQYRFRVGSFDDVVSVLLRMPSYVTERRDQATVSGERFITVSCPNWFKYQGDLSTARVRKFRARETPKKRREEKRTEESISPLPPQRFQKPTPAEVTAYAQSIGFDLNGEQFCAHYEAKGWVIGKTPMKDWKAAVRTWRKTDGQANGQRSFN